MGASSRPVSSGSSKKESSGSRKSSGSSKQTSASSKQTSASSKQTSQGSSRQTSGSSKQTSGSTKKSASTARTSSSKTSMSSKPAQSPQKSHNPSKVTKSKAKGKKAKRTEIDNLRKVYDEAERQLDPEDYGAARAYCIARIRAGIDVEVNEENVKALDAIIKEKENLMSQYPGHSYQVAQRLEFFKDLKKYLEEKGDKNKVLSTIDAIVTAYKSNNLKWKPGYVTYWSYGKRLSEHKVFNWDVFLALSKKHHGSEGFWVEGLHGASGAVRRFWRRTTCWPCRYIGKPVYTTAVKIPICLRMPEVPPESDTDPAPILDRMDPARPRTKYPYFSLVPLPGVMPWTFNAGQALPNVSNPPPKGPPVDRVVRHGRTNSDFVIFWMNDDTGSDNTSITEEDLDQVRRPDDPVAPLLPKPPLLGYVRVRGAAGSAVFEECRALEINLRGDDGRVMIKGKWDIIEVCITASGSNALVQNPARVAGPWVRHRFFTATIPDRTGRLYMIKKSRRFMNLLITPTRFDDSGLMPINNTISQDPEGA